MDPLRAAEPVTSEVRGRPTPTMRVTWTVLLGPRPPKLERLIQRRHELGIDLYDEGRARTTSLRHPAQHAYLDNVLAVLLHRYAEGAGLIGTGPFNLGADDYRVPDRRYHRGHPVGTWLATAGVVVEIVSPDDETYEKFASTHSQCRRDPRRRSRCPRPHHLETGLGREV